MRRKKEWRKKCSFILYKYADVDDLNGEEQFTECRELLYISWARWDPTTSASIRSACLAARTSVIQRHLLLKLILQETGKETKITQQYYYYRCFILLVYIYLDNDDDYILYIYVIYNIYICINVTKIIVYTYSRLYH